MILPHRVLLQNMIFLLMFFDNYYPIRTHPERVTGTIRLQLLTAAAICVLVHSSWNIINIFRRQHQRSAERVIVVCDWRMIIWPTGVVA